MDFEHRFRVPEHGFRLADHDPGDCAGLNKKAAKERREADLGRLASLQDRLYAEGRRALLLVLQGLDASGKDGTVKHVMRGVNPLGVTVTAFKAPTQLELQHDFLWRTQRALPSRGQIGVFNRSHYEEVVVVRVHPELLANQAIDPERAADPAFWSDRLEDIVSWERHLTREGTRVVKLFLHISKAEQLKRFRGRAERTEKHWKFEPADLREHSYWDAYQQVYEATLRATNTADAPWYVIPADHKWFLRTAVAAIVVEHLADMDPQYPMPEREQLAEMRAVLAELVSVENGAQSQTTPQPETEAVGADTQL
jgi:PPK2 family polyphosphate:nucleotide phosphotransferase